jgi:hypothetical protein
VPQSVAINNKKKKKLFTDSLVFLIVTLTKNILTVFTRIAKEKSRFFLEFPGGNSKFNKEYNFVLKTLY